MKTGPTGRAIFLLGTVIVLSGMFGFELRASEKPPPHKPQYNVSVFYGYPQIDTERKQAFFIKAVAQERTVM